MRLSLNEDQEGHGWLSWSMVFWSLTGLPLRVISEYELVFFTYFPLFYPPSFLALFLFHSLQSFQTLSPPSPPQNPSMTHVLDISFFLFDYSLSLLSFLYPVLLFEIKGRIRTKKLNECMHRNCQKWWCIIWWGVWVKIIITFVMHCDGEFLILDVDKAFTNSISMSSEKTCRRLPINTHHIVLIL